MTPSQEGWRTIAKDAFSPHVVRLAHWTPTQYFNVLERGGGDGGMRDRQAVPNKENVAFALFMLHY